GPGRGVERLRPDARHGRLRAPAGGGIRLLGPATYAAPLAAGPHRVAAPRLQPVLRTDLSAGAHQLLERYRARPGHAVAAPRDALRDRTPPTALAAPRIPDGATWILRPVDRAAYTARRGSRHDDQQADIRDPGGCRGSLLRRAGTGRPARADEPV